MVQRISQLKTEIIARDMDFFALINQHIGMYRVCGQVTPQYFADRCSLAKFNDEERKSLMGVLIELGLLPDPTDGDGSTWEDFGRKVQQISKTHKERSFVDVPAYCYDLENIIVKFLNRNGVGAHITS